MTMGCALLLGASAAAQSVPGSALTKGMKLIYASAGNEQAPWVVDSLDLNASWQNEKPCSYVRFGSRDVRRLCVSADTLFSWNEQQSRLVASRPVGANMQLRVPTSTGGHAVYETGAVEKVTVSGLTLDALPTTVTTYNAQGAVVRRLRERYVLALATALGGVFEVPDPQRAGQWNVQQEFILARIEK